MIWKILQAVIGLAYQKASLLLLFLKEVLVKVLRAVLYIYLFIYLFNNFIGYVYKLKMNAYTRKETKNG